MPVKFGYFIPEPSSAPQLEKAGFDSIWMPDHFAPFYHGFAMTDPAAAVSCMALPFLPQALSSTAKCLVGPLVLCPTLRYHPANIAQYFAQLDRQFPGRVILGVGTGEAVNATPFLGRFPTYRERRDRLREAIDLMRRLWTSRDYFTYDGQYYHMKDVFLYAKPKEPIPVVVSAFGEKSAELAGQVGDGIIIMGERSEHDRNRILQRFDDAATDVGKDPEAMIKIACFTGGVTSNLTAAVELSKTKFVAPLLCPISNSDPKSIEAKGQQMPDEEILQHMTLVPKGEDLIEHFDSALKMGINHIVMLDLTPVYIALNMAPPEAANWPTKVLPHLRDKYQKRKPKQLRG